MARMIDSLRVNGFRATGRFTEYMKEGGEGMLGGFVETVLYDSVPIVADNVVDTYIESKNTALIGMPSLMPPFPATWIEARFGGQAFGVLYMMDDDASIAIALLFLLDKRDGIVHGPLIQIDLPLDERGYFDAAASTKHSRKADNYQDLSDYFGKGRSEDYTLLMKDFTSEEDGIDLDHGASMEFVKIAMLAVGLMNCSNVGTVEVTPPPKLSKKRRKRYGMPLTTYRVIRVGPHLTTRGKKHSDESYVEGDAALPKHLIRGHFKTYEADRPLMGKHTGTFWWKAQVRGSKSAGEVRHEYEVEQ
jgi:hypothetical protein